MEFFKGKKKNWIIVLHKHHCGDCGHKSELIMDATKNEAEGYAKIKADEWRNGDIPAVTGIAIELPDCVHVVHQKPL